jgi:hypothetical protein
MDLFGAVAFLCRASASSSTKFSSSELFLKAFSNIFSKGCAMRILYTEIKKIVRTEKMLAVCYIYFMTWLKGILGGKSARLSDSKKRKKNAVRKATNRALKQYDKTFTDLARYDRAEKRFNSISR